MASEAVTSSGEHAQVKYHRRLDRTPEKHFHQLPERDKALISLSRKIREDTLTTVNKLKDDIEARDQEIEEERRLRQVAEEKLKSHLVDMYKNPEVNDELRYRLPRASKKCLPFDSLPRNPEKDLTHALKVTDEMDGGQRAEIRTPDLLHQREHRRTDDYPNINSGPEFRQHSINGGPDFERGQDQFRGRRYFQNVFQAHYPFSSSPYHSPTIHEGSAMYNSGRQAYPNLPFQSYVGPVSPVQYSPDQGHVFSPLMSKPLNQQGSSIPSSDQSRSESGFVEEKSSCNQSSGISQPRFRSCSLNDLNSLWSGFPNSQSYRVPLNRVPQCQECFGKGEILMMQLELERQTNTKLQERLADAERSLETLQVLHEVQVSEIKLQAREEAADLVREIYAAQTSRSEVDLQEIRVTDEQDPLFNSVDEYDRSEAHHEAGTESDYSDDEYSLNQDEEPHELLRKLDMFLAERKIVTLETERVVIERDKAVAKGKKLEEELRTTRQRQYHDAKGSEVALKRAQTLEAEVEILQLACSLQRDLSSRDAPGSDYSTASNSTRNEPYLSHSGK